MKIMLAQRRSQVGDIDRNLSVIEAVVSKSDADLIIFPELFMSGYLPRDQVSAIAEAEDGPTVSKISNICTDSSKSVIFGMPLRHPRVSGQITNSAVVVDSRGNIGRYDKTYLPTFGPFEEALYFSEGQSANPVEVSSVKVGVMICYDIFFPELSKLLALRGADLLVCISASPTATVENFMRLLPARAIENASYFAYVNSVGTHLDMVFGGMSRLLDPRGEIIASADPLEEGTVTGEFDPASLELFRRMRPTLRDSRSEVFEAMIQELRYR